MEDTTEAAEGACHCQTQQTSAISRLAAPFFPSWRVFIKYWQKSCCESMAANHCRGSVSIHCLGPWKTPQRQLKARATAKHNKHQPYQGWLPPFCLPGESSSSIGKKAVVSQWQPTIVVAVFLYIAWVHG